MLHGHASELARKALLLPFAGVAAVMVFFVISGFCIHWPYLHGRPPRLGAFYLQRFVRIGLPLAVAFVVQRLWGTEGWFRNMLWSVYCEIIYYALYPALRLLMLRLGTGRLVMTTFVISWLFCLLPDTGYGHIMCYGHAWTWLVCLPAWLCGCLLAEWMAGTQPVPALVEKMAGRISSHLALTRVSVWALSSVLLALGMQEWLHFKYSLPVFGALALVWLLVELRRPDTESWLSRSGVAAYSVFLIHPLAQSARLHGGPEWLLWMVKIAFAALVSAVFYFVVEKPSHQLARWLGGSRR